MTDWDNIKRDISTCRKVIEGTLAEFEEIMHKCSSPFCDELSAKYIFIPLEPCNKVEFSAIGLCQYHFDRFEERYEDKWDDTYDNPESMT